MSYKKVVFADSPLTLTAASVQAINMNNNELTFDVDTTAGAVIINLPSITSLSYGVNATLNATGQLVNATGGTGAMSFYINGNILAGANSLTINPYSQNTGTEVDIDFICGARSSVLTGAATCFQVAIAGRHAWMIFSCTNVQP